MNVEGITVRLQALRVDHCAKVGLALEAMFGIATEQRERGRGWTKSGEASSASCRQLTMLLTRYTWPIHVWAGYRVMCWSAGKLMPFARLLEFWTR
jgi:hypothetical protein